VSMVRFLKVWFFVLLTTMVGCGEGGGFESVHGTVTLDGEPLANCKVVFSPTEGGRRAVASTDENGEYELASSLSQSGILPGSYVVHMTTAETDQGDGDGGVAQRVPLAYRAKNAPTVEVTDSGGQFDFDLKSSGK